MNWANLPIDNCNCVSTVLAVFIATSADLLFKISSYKEKYIRIADHKFWFSIKGG